MSLVVNKESESEFERAPEGQFVARCYSLVDIGTQQVVYRGKTKWVKQVVIGWELLDDEHKMKDGRPFAISKTYTANLYEKSKLFADLNSWRGKKFTDDELEAFDLHSVLGAYCRLQIVHEESKNGRTYANVNALMAYTGTKPEGVNELVSFDMDEPDPAAFNRLPDFLKRKIQAAPEFGGTAQDGYVLAEVAPAKPAREDEPPVESRSPQDQIDLSSVPF